MVWDLPVPVIATAVGSFCGFLTAVAGFGLNAWLTWKRQQEATALQSANVRTLIACEIEHNLSTLRAYLDGLNSLGNILEPGKGIVVAKPTYSKAAYNCYLAAMPLALDPEEIQEVFRFYSELESLTPDNHPNWHPAFEIEEGAMVHSLGVQRLMWRTYKEFANDRLNQGNPLR